MGKKANERRKRIVQEVRERDAANGRGHAKLKTRKFPPRPAKPPNCCLYKYEYKLPSRFVPCASCPLTQEEICDRLGASFKEGESTR